MTVALSSLRVVTEGDSTSYVKSMADVASSSDRAATSVVNASSRFERLQRSLDPAYASQVRLAQAQNTLGSAVERGVISTGRYNELMALAGTRFDDATRKAGPLGKVFEGISGQLIALSAGAGPVGVTLAALGPVGLAAAVGIGATVEAFRYLSEQANALGEKSSKLHDFAETAGVTATQLQILEKAGAGVGLTADKLEQSFERFSVQLSELQKGSGTFYTELQKVNPALTLQLATTKDVAKAWDILSQAYAEADGRQQALIAHAAFGRGGGATGRLLSATAEAGGIGGLQGKISPADIIDDATVQRLGTLKTQIDAIKAATRDIWASMYAESVLANQRKFEETQHEIAVSVKETGGWWQYILETMAKAQETQELILTDMDNARSRIARGMGSNLATGKGGDNIYYPSSYDRPPRPAGPAEGPDQPGAAFVASQAKANVAALGSAATAYEQQKAKILELDVALKDHTITQDTYNRVVSALKLDTVIALEGQRLGLLGELASVSEIVAQKENQIVAARIKGVKITDDEAAAVKLLTQVQTESARLQEKISIGTASESEIRANLAKVLEEYKTKKLYDPNDPIQLAAANVTLGKSFEKMSEQAKLARAPLEQLKKWELDAGNFRLQIDTASVSTLNQMTTSIVDFTTGTKTATQAFQDFGKSTIKILEELIVKMLLARALGLLGLGGGGGGAPFSNPYSGMPAGSNPTFHSGGMADEPSGFKYAHPSVFMNAPRFHSGVGPDEMPAIVRRDEGIFTPGQMRALGHGGAGGGNHVQVNVINQAEGTGVRTSKRREGNVDVHDIIIATVNKHMANGGFDGPLRARTGTQLQPRGR